MSNIKIDSFLDLSTLFSKLEDKSYCIIKLPDEFPFYQLGSDLDIFCYDVQDIANVILSNIQESITSDLKIEIIDNKKQIYIDIIHNDKIHLRFDLYGDLPYYKNLKIKKAFFSSVIEHSETINKGNCKVKVPSLIDESILRYIEYHEWYAQRPDKIKHIQYLKDKIIQNSIDINKMFDKLHYYIAIPKIEDDRGIASNDSVRSIQYVYENIKKVVKSVQKNGFKDTALKIKGKIFK